LPDLEDTELYAATADTYRHEKGRL